MFSFGSPALFLFFPSRHSCPVLVHTLRFWPKPPQTRLLADTINLHRHIKHAHWSWEKDKPEISSPPPFFLRLLIGSFISSNAVSLTWSTNRKHCCENGVLMFGVRARSVWNQTLTGRCNGLGFKGSRFLWDFRDGILLRPSSYETQAEVSNSDQPDTKCGSYRCKCSARIGIDLSDCWFHVSGSVVSTDALQAVFIKPFRVAARNRTEWLSGAKNTPPTSEHDWGILLIKFSSQPSPFIQHQRFTAIIINVIIKLIVTVSMCI